MTLVWQKTFETGDPGTDNPASGDYTPQTGWQGSGFGTPNLNESTNPFASNGYSGGSGGSNCLVLAATNAQFSGIQSNNDGNGGDSQAYALIQLPTTSGHSVSLCFRDTGSSFHNTDYFLQLAPGVGISLFRRVGNSNTQLGTTVAGTAATLATLAGIGTYVECNVYDSLGTTNISCYVQLLTGANAGDWIDFGGSPTGSRTPIFSTTDSSPITGAGTCGVFVNSGGIADPISVDNLTLNTIPVPVAGGVNTITETSASVVIAANAASGGTGILTYQWARAASNTGYAGAVALANGSGISGAQSLTFTDASSAWTGLAIGTLLWYFLRVTDADGISADYSFAVAAQPQVDAQGRYTSELERPWNVAPQLRPDSTLYMRPFAQEVALSGYNANFGATTTGMLGPYGAWNTVDSMTAYPPHFDNLANQFPTATAAPWTSHTIRFDSGSGDGFASSTSDMRAALFIPCSGLFPPDAWTATYLIRFLAAQSSLSTPIQPCGLYISSGILCDLQITATTFQVVWKHDQAATAVNQTLSVNTAAFDIQSGDDVVVKVVLNAGTLSIYVACVNATNTDHNLLLNASRSVTPFVIVDGSPLAGFCLLGQGVVSNSTATQVGVRCFLTATASAISVDGNNNLVPAFTTPRPTLVSVDPTQLATASTPAAWTSQPILPAIHSEFGQLSAQNVIRRIAGLLGSNRIVALPDETPAAFATASNTSPNATTYPWQGLGSYASGVTANLEIHYDPQLIDRTCQYFKQWFPTQPMQVSLCNLSKLLNSAQGAFATGTGTEPLLTQGIAVSAQAVKALGAIPGATMPTITVSASGGTTGSFTVSIADAAKVAVGMTITGADGTAAVTGVNLSTGAVNLDASTALTTAPNMGDTFTLSASPAQWGQMCVDLLYRIIVVNGMSVEIVDMTNEPDAAAQKQGFYFAMFNAMQTAVNAAVAASVLPSLKFAGPSIANDPIDGNATQQNFVRGMLNAGEVSVKPDVIVYHDYNADVSGYARNRQWLELQTNGSGVPLYVNECGWNARLDMNGSSPWKFVDAAAPSYCALMHLRAGMEAQRCNFLGRHYNSSTIGGQKYSGETLFHRNGKANPRLLSAQLWHLFGQSSTAAEVLCDCSGVPVLAHANKNATTGIVAILVVNQQWRKTLATDVRVQIANDTSYAGATVTAYVVNDQLNWYEWQAGTDALQSVAPPQVTSDGTNSYLLWTMRAGEAVLFVIDKRTTVMSAANSNVPGSFTGTAYYQQVGLSWTLNGNTSVRVRRNGKQIYFGPGAYCNDGGDQCEGLPGGTAITYAITGLDAHGNESVASTITVTPSASLDSNTLPTPVFEAVACISDTQNGELFLVPANVPNLHHILWTDETGRMLTTLPGVFSLHDLAPGGHASATAGTHTYTVAYVDTSGNIGGTATAIFQTYASEEYVRAFTTWTAAGVGTPQEINYTPPVISDFNTAGMRPVTLSWDSVSQFGSILYNELDKAGSVLYSGAGESVSDSLYAIGSVEYTLYSVDNSFQGGNVSSETIGVPSGWTTAVQLTRYADDVNLGIWENGSAYLTYTRNVIDDSEPAAVYRLTRHQPPVASGDWGSETPVQPTSYQVYPNNQFVVTLGAQTGGTWTLQWSTQQTIGEYGVSGTTTVPLSYNAPANTGAGNVQDALNDVQSLFNFSGPQVTVTGPPGGPYAVTIASSAPLFPGLLTGNGSQLSAPANFFVSPVAVTFTLDWAGQTTSALANTIDAATIAAALQSLSTVGAGAATVVGPGGGPWCVTIMANAATPPTAITGALTGSESYPGVVGIVDNLTAGPYFGDAGTYYGSAIKSQSIGGGYDYARRGGNRLHWIGSTLTGFRGFSRNQTSVIGTTEDGTGWQQWSDSITPDFDGSDSIGSLNAAQDGFRSAFLFGTSPAPVPTIGSRNYSGMVQATPDTETPGTPYFMRTPFVQLSDGTLAQLLFTGNWVRVRTPSPNSFTWNNSGTATSVTATISIPIPNTTDTLTAYSLIGLTYEEPVPLITGVLPTTGKPSKVTVNVPGTLRYQSDPDFTSTLYSPFMLIWDAATYMKAINGQIVVGSDNTSGYNPATGNPTYNGSSDVLNDGGTVDTTSANDRYSGHTEAGRVNLNATDVTAIVNAHGSSETLNITYLGLLQPNILSLKFQLFAAYDSVGYGAANGYTTVVGYLHSTTTVIAPASIAVGGQPYAGGAAWNVTGALTLLFNNTPTPNTNESVDVTLATTLAPTGYTAPLYNLNAYALQNLFAYEGDFQFMLVRSRDGGITWDYSADCAPIAQLTNLAAWNNLGILPLMPTLTATGQTLCIQWVEGNEGPGSGVPRSVISSDVGETWVG